MAWNEPGGGGNGHYVDFIAMRREFPIRVKQSTWGQIKNRYRTPD